MDKHQGNEPAGTHNSDVSFKDLFLQYSSFGDRESHGETITLKNIDKWLTQAHLLGGKSKITNADTAITFSKIAKKNKHIDINEFQHFLEVLASEKKMEATDLIARLQAAGHPGMTHVTMPVSSGAAAANLERMTDTSLYTGSHKERFDEEGHGRGKEGREDTTESSGYVTGYKGKDSYNEERKEMPVSSGAAAANLERMTDTSLSTGSHKERFDEEGHGRGKEGREDTTESSGYVTGYKGKDSYNEERKEMPVSSGAAAANLERMTDTSLSTGSHKERFDEEGHGRGKEGREDTTESSGYVTGYKGKDSYNEEHKE